MANTDKTEFDKLGCKPMAGKAREIHLYQFPEGVLRVYLDFKGASPLLRLSLRTPEGLYESELAITKKNE